MAGKITTNSIQLGDSATATQNFVLQTNLDGTAKLSRGNLGVTTQDVLSVSAAGVVTLLAPPVVPAQSMVRLNTANGYGSTNTAIRRFTNVVTNQGTDITYADSAPLGASFTINTSGVYSISFSDSNSTNINMGISINSTQLNTDISTVNAGDILAIATPSAGSAGCVAGSWYFAASAIIRPHCQPGFPTSGSRPAVFTITRAA